MKTLSTATLFLAMCLGACRSETEVTFSAGALEVGVASSGQILHMTGHATGADYLATGVPAPLLSIQMDGRIHQPTSAEWRPGESALQLTFPDEILLGVRIHEKGTHATLEVISVSNTSAVDLVVWGPYPTILDETVGETVGVVRENGFAIGLQALNPKTLGGYPWNENDAMPQLDIFESDDYSDLTEEGKRYVLYRVEAAKPDSFGSTLQAYTRDRSHDRTIPNMRFDEYLAPAFDDGGVIGSRIALFGSPEDEALATIGAIELAEGLPHPMLDGVWAKQSPRAAQAYVIMPFGEDTVDEALDVVARAGMQVLYHPDPFSSWGHFELRRDDFPNGLPGLKRAVERATARGMRVGGHTLSNFIHPHDAYVSPVPDPRLARIGHDALSAGVDVSQRDIPVMNPDLFISGEATTLRTVVIGEELIQYASVSGSPPWRLLRVERGAFGTRAAAHAAGDSVGLMADHGYRVFLTNPALSIEMAHNLAHVFEEAGLRHISFDGLEGNRSTGMGNYGEVLFTQSWFDALAEGAQQDLIVTASRTSHFFWHLYTRMNWGEPWYAGFRESQTEYRMKNQKYFQRNYMPGMLGWFSMRAETSVEDIEWMLARSAAYDAGYAFYTSLEVLEKHGRSGEILDLLALWEEARLSGAFSDDQKTRMEDVSGEFHLEENPDGSWTLFPVASHRQTFGPRERQPSEPTGESLQFENQGDQQPLVLLITAVGGELSNVRASLDGVDAIIDGLRLREGETLRVDGGPTAIVYGPSWQIVRRLDVKDALVSPGAHRVELDVVYGSPKAEAKAEIRTTGEGEAAGG